MTRLKRNNEVVMGNDDARKSLRTSLTIYVLWVSISSRSTRDFHLWPVSGLEIWRLATPSFPIFHTHLSLPPLSFCQPCWASILIIMLHWLQLQRKTNPRSFGFPLSLFGTVTQISPTLVNGRWTTKTCPLQVKPSIYSRISGETCGFSYAKLIRCYNK